MDSVRRFCRVPLAVPYWTGATYRKILYSLCSGKVIDGAELEGLRLLIIQELGVENALLCSSGSLALELALRAFRVGRGDEVVIPTFCCAAVVLPILAVGATPVLADVGEELNLTVDTVGAALTRNTKAVIVPHLFGNPAEIVPIVELARAKNIRVIDDAAQALGATIDGRPVGSFGDAGILSFGAEKVCFGLGGGVLVISNRDFLREDLSAGLARPALAPTLGNFLSTLVWRRWRRWTLPLHALARKDSPGPEAPVNSYRNERLPNLNAAVALTLVQSLRENIAARRVRSRAYADLLSGVDGLKLISHQQGSAYLAQVIQVRHGRTDLAAAVIEALRYAGYEIQGSYVPIHRLANYSMCVWDALPRAERIWSDLIELPCEPNVTLEDVERIAGIIRATINSQNTSVARR